MDADPGSSWNSRVGPALFARKIAPETTAPPLTDWREGLLRVQAGAVTRYQGHFYEHNRPYRQPLLDDLLFAVLLRLDLVALQRHAHAPDLERLVLTDAGRGHLAAELSPVFP